MAMRSPDKACPQIDSSGKLSESNEAVPSFETRPTLLHPH